MNRRVEELEFILPDGTEFFIDANSLQEIVEFMRWKCDTEYTQESFSELEILLIKDIYEMRY